MGTPDSKDKLAIAKKTIAEYVAYGDTVPSSALVALGIDKLILKETLSLIKPHLRQITSGDSNIAAVITEIGLKSEVANPHSVDLEQRCIRLECIPNLTIRMSGYSTNLELIITRKGEIVVLAGHGHKDSSSLVFFREVTVSKAFGDVDDLVSFLDSLGEYERMEDFETPALRITRAIVDQFEVLVHRAEKRLEGQRRTLKSLEDLTGRVFSRHYSSMASHIL